MLQHLHWARELLNFSAPERQRAFELEFLAYWNRRSNSQSPRVLSLLKTGGVDREVFYINDWPRARIVVADDKAELLNWLRNSGSTPSDKNILPTRLTRLPRPWTPDQYPEHGRDALRLLPETALRRVLIPGQLCPLIFEARTANGAVFATVLLQGASERELVKGFRELRRVPIDRIASSFGSRMAQRCSVARVDERWVHGRDHDNDFPAIRAKSVALIGCGSLGAALARLLAQAGVGTFVLVDADRLTPANTSRHVLGMRFVDKNKSLATKQMLQEDFPHIQPVTAFTKRFEQLTTQELGEISNADLIISAGIDFDGDISLDSWRHSLATPPAHLCTWAEAFAIVGHAVLLYSTDKLMTGFDDSEQPSFRLTDWPEDSDSVVIEAGCGNLFQPHGAVDLQPTITLAARLAIDTLLGKVPASCRRVWQGQLDAVAANGGAAREGFTESHITREMPWT